ncbi:3'-5' exonuclease, partial [Ellagibacter isourolithinifaciens]|uniref:3'-5' exonuclease n=1 Tax=Ellagibacter isourolithinifaciens TaxID=2137581 RepID=UPI003A905B71
MAILLQSTKGAKAGPYLCELRRRGIPVIVSGGSDFFLQPEVSTVSMLLRVLADRDDDEALFALLGSGFFDASDDALLALSVINRQCLKLLPGESRAKPSLYDALCLYVEKAQGNLDKSLTRAFDTLEHALSASPGTPLAQIVREAIALSGWQATLAARGIEGGAVFANIERMCDLIDDYEALNGHAPFATSSYFRGLVDMAHEGMAARAKLGTLVSSGSNAVRIMTIHSSKGLEFPIVAVAEFEKSARNTGAQLISLSEEGKRYLALGVTGSNAAARYLVDEDQDPGSFALASEVAEHRAHAHQLKKLRDAQEQQRLLYVALTRARDKLILVTHDGAFASKGDLSAGLTGSCLHAVFGKDIPAGHAQVTTDAGALVELVVTEVPHG